MRIRELTAHIVRLPLKRPFRHASAERHESKNILIRCTLADGTAGWGEGVPRSYVTGETPEGCLEQLAATPLGDQLNRDCTGWTDVVAMAERFAPVVTGDDARGHSGNALRCAVELSVLDAFGRLYGEPLSKVGEQFAPAAPISARNDEVRYSAVIDSGSRRLPRKALVRRLFGFLHCKVKVGADGDDDVARLRIIRRWCGAGMDLRVDANEAWHADEARERIASLLKFKISAIEQPVPHADVESLATIRKELDVAIMLDESLTSMIDAQRAIKDQTCDLFNIRLSKCGGYLNSLRLASAAHSAGIGYQLGCHPGESGVLSAAGRHWAASVANVRYVEGSYDRFLFRRLLTNEDLTFRFGGRGARLVRPGLGVTVNEAVLRETSVFQRDFGVM